MKRKNFALFAPFATFASFAILAGSAFCPLALHAQSRYSIIPQPVSLEEREGVFRFSNATVIEYPVKCARAAEIATDFCAQLNLVSGLKTRAQSAALSAAFSAAISAAFPTTNSTTHSTAHPATHPATHSTAQFSPAAIFDQLLPQRVVLRFEAGMAEEAYTLSVTPLHIVVTAATPTGLYWGIQTISQLLPPQIYGEKKVAGLKWEVPCCEIKDEPRFSYRGLMLDCGRYFMPKEVIFKFIDVMSMHKQNMFHWHLTEDQGWRIEIKKYPRLTEVGAWRKETTGYSKSGGDGVPHGGFYTQEDAREVVEYARRRGVTVVPEIELPGHSVAALAAYPELSCFPDREYEVATSWGIKKDILSPSATTFRFLEDVFTELFDIFPSPYYHIGGDEAPRDIWKESDYVQDLMTVMGMKEESEMQIFFVRRMADFLREKGGKTVIGWDEILDGGAVPGTVVMSYRGHSPAVRAAKLGIQTIVAANRWNYLDYYQEDPMKEVKSQGLFIPMSKIYNYFPIPDTVDAAIRKYFIGQQGCVWGEYVQNAQRAEYKAFPRAVAMSETAWCDRDNKDWDSFRVRMLKGFERLDQKKVGYSRAFWNVIFHYEMKNDGYPVEGYPKEVELTIDYPGAIIRYTTDGSVVTAKSPQYTGTIIVNQGDMIRAQGYLPNGKTVGVPVDKRFGTK